MIFIDLNDSTGVSLRLYFSRRPQLMSAPNLIVADTQDSPTSSSTPAWQSDTVASPLWPPVAEPCQSPLQPAPTPLHPLLDPRLLNAPLKVTLTGGSFTGVDVVISLKEISGRLGLFYVARKKHTPVDPIWVTLRHPNPWRDNGLLVVVSGENCGKFIRRIRHVDRNGVGMIMVVAMMQQVPGQCDKICGELEFKPEELCISEELSEQKKLNANVMADIRRKAQKEF